MTGSNKRSIHREPPWVSETRSEPAPGHRRTAATAMGGPCSAAGHLRQRIAAAIATRLDGRDESGQVLIIVVILIVLLAALGPVMVSQVTSDSPLLLSSTNKHAALAAAEAGIQWYRNHLDTNPSYYSYTATNNPTNDAALSGWCGAGQPSTCDLSGTSPPEAFHYVADDSHLFAQTGAAAGTVTLTVTGRAGSPGSYSYVSAESSFSTTSLLDNAYYSSYEVLDPSSQTIQGYDVTTTDASGNQTTVPETSYNISYSYVDGAGNTVDVNNVSVWQALCRYTTYNANTFLDAVGQPNNTTGGTASASAPYYGPYFGGGFNFNVDSSGVVDPAGATTVSVPSLPCESPYDFVAGETFDGPAYTNDQLHVCSSGGSPQFNGKPVSLTSGAPSNVAYLPAGSGPPGAVKVTTANDSTASPPGPYPSSLLGQYVPAGVTTDNVNCGGGGDTPSLAYGPWYGPALNGNQSLPSLNSALAQYGTASPPSGTIGTGCTYTGPTMIELVYNSTTGATTMDVWSPLSASSATTGQCGSSGGTGAASTFSATNPFVTGIPLPSDGVVYVQDYTIPSGGSPPTVPADGSSPCFNPYQSALPVTSAQCYEGDVYVEGELHGQLTVGSSANIMVTRDLTDTCAVPNAGAGPIGSTRTDPSASPTCASQSTPDIIGLSAKYDVLISGNNPSNPAANTVDCVSSGFGDGTGAPANSGAVINGTSYPLDPAAVWPTLCNPTNVVIDAAVLALNGSFGIENWDTTPQSGGAYLNGSDLSEFRGPFGYVGMTGYNKEFSFDSRLQYAPPPHALSNTVTIWQEGNYVVCPTTSCPAIP